MNSQRLKKIFLFIVRVWVLTRYLPEILSSFEIKLEFILRSTLAKIKNNRERV